MIASSQVRNFFFRPSTCLGLAALLLLYAFWPMLAFAHDVSEVGRERMASGGTLEIIWTGAEHMIEGYDHLLFLLGVMFFLTRFIQILKFVTAFTVGHTITLIFATYAGITANHYLIDAVIAVTVAYKGFENLDGFRRWFGVQAPNLLFMVFLFGLIHGFGLSAQLQTMTLREDPNLLSKILLFNVGVEVGQIMALVVMAIAIRAWQKVSLWPLLSRIINWGLVGAGMVLLVYQLSGYTQERQQMREAAAGALEFELFAEGEFLLGQLRRVGGAPLVDTAQVIVTSETGETTTVRTDADGWFSFVGEIDRHYELQAVDAQGRDVVSSLTLGEFALDLHEHDHIPIYVYGALFFLLSLIPAYWLRRRELVLT